MSAGTALCRAIAPIQLASSFNVYSALLYSVLCIPGIIIPVDIRAAIVSTADPRQMDPGGRACEVVAPRTFLRVSCPELLAETSLWSEQGQENISSEMDTSHLVLFCERYPLLWMRNAYTACEMK